MTDIGGGDSPLEYLISHTYPTQRPLTEVWPLYEKLSHTLRD
jgi:hypothetical protein